MGVPSRVLWLWWSGRAAMAQEKYKDPKQPVGARVKDLLAEKIGQIDRSVASAQVMRDYFIEWIIIFPSWDGIPMIYGIDAVLFMDTTMSIMLPFSHIILALELLGKDPELLRRIGDATAIEARATGIPYVFAPCIAVS
nr:lysosomal beta glucosidase-like [Ipomoea batatas]